MKFLAYLLIAALALAVAYDCNVSIDAALAQYHLQNPSCHQHPTAQDLPSADHREHDEHPCSPFCDCDCCVVHAIAQQGVSLPLQAFSYPLPRVELPTTAPRSAQASIWHPPKV